MKVYDDQYFDNMGEVIKALGYDPSDDTQDYTEELTGKTVVVSFFSAFTNPDGLVLDESLGYLISYDWDRDWGGANFHVTGPVRRSTKQRLIVESTYTKVDV